MLPPPLTMPLMPDNLVDSTTGVAITDIERIKLAGIFSAAVDYSNHGILYR